MNTLLSSRRVSRGGLVVLGFLLALCVTPAAFAAGQINGQVSGYVYDPTGAPLAEVPITLTGPTLPKDGLNRTSDDDGRYEFGQVPPGEDYVLEVNVPGFQPIKRSKVTVFSGKTSPVDIRLAVLTETQAVATYEIVEKVNPIMNPDSAQTGATVNAEKAADTPIFHQVQGVPQLVAGVGPGNTPSTRGGLSRWGKFYLDGMDTTDISDGSITAPMNFEQVENFEVVTGGLDAQYNSLGMVENVVTKSGTNNWQYDLNLTLQPPFMAAKNSIPSNQPDAFGVYTNNSAALPNTSFYSPILNVGGPIIKDKLWFYASGQLNLSKRETSITTAVTPLENRSTDTVTQLGRLKLTWQPTEKDRLSVALNLDRNTIDNSIGNSGVTADAEQRIDRGGYFVIANYDHNFSENVLFQLQTGGTYKNVLFEPQVKSEAIAHQDSGTRLVQFNLGALGGAAGAANWQKETKYRLQFDPMLIWKIKNHQMKAGLQLSYLGDVNRTWVIGGTRFIDRNGGICNPDDPSTFSFCNQKQTFYNTDGEQSAEITSASGMLMGLFLQDRWTVGRKLTLVPGFRFDVGRLFADGRQLATTNLVGYGPRLSGTYDVFGDRKDLVVAHYGRSNDVGDVFIAQRGNPSLTQVIASWNGSAFPDCQPNVTATGCTTSGGSAGRSLAPRQTPPHVDEVSLGYHHETKNNAVFGVDLTYRRYSNLWAEQEVNRIYDASGQRIIGYADEVAHSVLVGKTLDDAFRTYTGMDLWVQGTPGRWDLLASYTLAYNYGTVSNYFDGYGLNPRMDPFYYGPLPDDQRHTIKGSIAYRSDWHLNLGARFRYITGRPMWQNFSNPADSSQRLYRSPRGTGFAYNSSGVPDFNDPNSWAEMRGPSQFIIDLQATYDLGTAIGMKQKMELIFLVVDVLNNYDPTSLTDTYSTSGNRFGLTGSGRNGPLQAEVILRFRNW